LNKKLLLVAFLLCFSGAILFAANSNSNDKNVFVSNGKLYVNLKDTDIKNALQVFAKATGKNISTSDDVKGKITITFSGIDPQSGLESVLRTKGLDWFEDNGTIYVSTKRVLRNFALMNAKPSDLLATLTTILPQGSTVSADDNNNSLVVQTTSDYILRIEKLINELDVSPTQVVVEAKLIEISRTNDTSVGLDLSYSRNGSSVKTTNLAGRDTATDAQGLYAHALSFFTPGSLEAYLSALSTQKKVNLVAAPRITTLNNKEASILIGSKFGYKTTITSQTNTSQVINFLSVGTSLILTPNITRNGNIRMKVAPKISTGSVTNDLPTENTTETMNEVLVADGQTFVIGGLLNEKENITDYGIPFLMDIPIIGGIFRKSVPSTEKTELLVFVTPHIVTPEYLKTLNAPIIDMEKRHAEEKAGVIH